MYFAVLRQYGLSCEMHFAKLKGSRIMIYNFLLVVGQHFSRLRSASNIAYNGDVYNLGHHAAGTKVAYLGPALQLWVAYNAARFCQAAFYTMSTIAYQNLLLKKNGLMFSVPDVQSYNEAGWAHFNGVEVRGYVIICSFIYISQCCGKNLSLFPVWLTMERLQKVMIEMP